MSSETAKTFCQNCSQYIESSKFFLHERMCSQNVKKCPKCNKPFNIDDLDEHYKQEHSYIICDLCNMKFPQGQIEKHKANCDYRFVSCKYCELNVIFLELEEHENVCGSTTQKCEKCDLYIEKKNFANHICQKKQNEYFNENINIDMIEEDKKEKKKIKKITSKKGKKMKKSNQKELLENDSDLFTLGIYQNKENNRKNNNKELKFQEGKEILNDINNNINIDDIDINMMYTEKEIQNQKKMLNHFERINKEKEDKKEDKKEKKKNKKKKNKEKEDEKEEEIKLNNNKNKKGKKNKQTQNNKTQNHKNNIYNEDEYEYEYYFAGNKKMNLHNIKFDIQPEEYKNYNNYNHGYNNDYEEKMIREAIKLSLLDK